MRDLGRRLSHQHPTRRARPPARRPRAAPPPPRPRRSIRVGKDTGLRNLPSSAININRVWCVAATIACDLLCWLRLLCLDGPLATAEPKTLRYRLLHTAARIVRGQRKRTIRIPTTWP